MTSPQGSFSTATTGPVSPTVRAEGPAAGAPADATAGAAERGWVRETRYLAIARGATATGSPAAVAPSAGAAVATGPTTSTAASIATTHDDIILSKNARIILKDFCNTFVRFLQFLIIYFNFFTKMLLTVS